MKTLKLFFAAAAAALSLAACGDGQAPSQPAANAGPSPAAARATPAATPTPDELAQARSDYNNFCVRCHKEDGGGGKFELEEGGTIDVLSLRKHGLKDSDKELAGHIANGGKKMPAFKDRLSPERIDGLVRFIRVEYHGRTAGSTTSAVGSATPAAGAVTSATPAPAASPAR